MFWQEKKEIYYSNSFMKLCANILESTIVPLIILYKTFYFELHMRTFLPLGYKLIKYRILIYIYMSCIDIWMNLSNQHFGMNFARIRLSLN